MILKRNEKLYGVSVVTVRNLLKYIVAQPGRFNSEDSFYRLASLKTKIGLPEIRDLIEKLVVDGYLEFLDNSSDADGWDIGVTEKGCGLSVAKCLPVITRARAETLLKGFLSRVGDVNENPEYAYIITSVKVFGSFITEKETLGDLDLAISTRQRTSEGKAFSELWWGRIAIAVRNGRTFGNSIERSLWPLEEIVRYLKNKQRNISVHILSSDEIATNAEGRVVFEY